MLSKGSLEEVFCGVFGVGGLYKLIKVAFIKMEIRGLATIVALLT